MMWGMALYLTMMVKAMEVTGAEVIVVGDEIETNTLFENVTVEEKKDVVDIQKAYEESLEELKKTEADLNEGTDIVEDINDDIDKARDMHDKVKKLNLFFIPQNAHIYGIIMHI